MIGGDETRRTALLGEWKSIVLTELTGVTG
jgi:hypothetical protein